MLSLNRFAKLVVAASFVLVVAGAVVSGTGSGLAVTTWPSLAGAADSGAPGAGVAYQRLHRLAGAAVGLMTIGLASWVFVADGRRLVKAAAAAAAGAVILQGVLGGVAVLYSLPPLVSTAHAALAHAFFAGVVAVAVVTSPGWLRRFSAGAGAATQSEQDEDRRRWNEVASDTRLRSLACWTVLFTYLQVLLGAAMRQTQAGLAIPDYPLAFGSLLPSSGMLAVGGVALNLAHRASAPATVLLTVLVVRRIFVRHPRNGELTRPAAILASVVLLQVALGGVVVLTGLGVVVSSAHVAGGALALGAAAVVALRAWRPLMSNDAARLAESDRLSRPARVPTPSSASALSTTRVT